MGGSGSRFSRPFKNYNVEARAHKLISKNEKRPAPTYKSVEKQRKIVDEMFPEYKKIADTKDTNLDNHLKKVFVTSTTNQEPEISSRNDPERPLPQDTTVPAPFEYGFYEPEQTVPGRLTLRQALEVLNKYSADPEKNSVEVLAKDYKMDRKSLADILEYYKIYQIVDIKFNHNRDSVARPIRISTKSGIMVPHTPSKKAKDKQIQEKEDKILIDPRKQIKDS